MKAKNVEEEYLLLQQMYEDLKKKSKIPRTVYVEKEVEKVVEVKTRIGDQVDTLFNMFGRNKDWVIKKLLFAVLYYQGLYKKNFRENFKNAEIKRRLQTEYLERLNEIYQKMLMNIVRYMSKIFMKCVSTASKTKRKSTIVFQVTMHEIKHRRDPVLTSMLALYKE